MNFSKNIFLSFYPENSNSNYVRFDFAQQMNLVEWMAPSCSKINQLDREKVGQEELPYSKVLYWNRTYPIIEFRSSVVSLWNIDYNIIRSMLSIQVYSDVINGILVRGFNSFGRERHH